MRPLPSRGSACRLLLRGGTLGPTRPWPVAPCETPDHAPSQGFMASGHSRRGLIYILTPEDVTAFIGMVFSIYQYSRRLYLIYR